MKNCYACVGNSSCSVGIYFVGSWHTNNTMREAEFIEAYRTASCRTKNGVIRKIQ
mgnify:CR=1 FL=1